MAFENVSDFISQVLRGDFQTLEGIIYLAISIAIYAIFIWHFYRFIARRDCFKISTRKYPKLVGFLKYFFLYPFVAFLFFMGFSLIMNFLTVSLDIKVVLSTSFALIIAIRITSYYNEDLSKDLAKMLPFALLGIFLVDPSYFGLGSQPQLTMLDSIYSIPQLFTDGVQYILFIVLVEWILRILLTIRYAIFPKKQQIPSEES